MPSLSFPRNLLAVLVAIACVAPALEAKHKDREWQTGKLLDSNHSRIYAGAVGSASGSTTDYGNSSQSTSTGSSTAVYRVFETYTIETADRIYVCEERVRWRWSKSAMLTVNAPVQFAIEKDHLYIKDENGKEHDTHIRKKVLKATPL